MYASKVHVNPLRLYTYTAPAPEQELSVEAVEDMLVEQLSSLATPMARVSHCTTTYFPKLSFSSALGAVSLSNEEAVQSRGGVGSKGGVGGEYGGRCGGGIKGGECGG